jgi:hypothetical protein
VAAAEEREEVVGMLREDREASVLGVEAGEDRGDGVDRPGVHGGGVPKPGGVAGKRGEARAAGGVDRAALVEERGRRDLVEDHDDYRRGRGSPVHARLRLALEDECPNGRGEEEEGEEEEWRD